MFFCWRIKDIAATGFVVAATILRGNNLVVFIDIRGKAMMSATFRAGQARLLAGVFEEVVFIFHGCRLYMVRCIVSLVPCVPLVERMEQMERFLLEW